MDRDAWRVLGWIASVYVGCVVAILIWVVAK